MKNLAITTLFLDIGGVLLTNGWDRHAREKAVKKFQLDGEEINKRHSLLFDTYEIGKMTLETYLQYVVFYTHRNFSTSDFIDFMFEQSQPFPAMIELVKSIKKKYSLRTVAVSNEGRELMDHRIKTFDLRDIIDFFVCSGYVGLRKPDEQIYRLTLDLAQVTPQEVLYIDDREVLVQIGSSLGLNTFQHTSLEQTAAKFNQIFSLHS